MHDEMTAALAVARRGMVPRTEGTFTLEQVEAWYIRRVLEREKGNQTLAAQVLGISRSTLWRKVKLYHLQDVVR